MDEDDKDFIKLIVKILWWGTVAIVGVLAYFKGYEIGHEIWNI